VYIRPARLTAVSVLVAALFGVLALAVHTPPASAATPCWKPIQDDWVDDGIIQGVYPLHCYNEAINHVPNDLKQYTGIVEDIQAARQRAARGNLRTTQGHNDAATRARANQDPKRSLFAQGFDKLGPNNANSVPLPLLILAGLALLLIAAGGAGLVSRHLKARKVPG